MTIQPIEERNGIQSFNFNGHQLRGQLIDGGPWFVAMDVANALDYSDTFKMTNRLDGDEVQNRQIGGFGNRGVNLINESGLYSAILGSRKPEAKAFKKWVTSEVLPAIRKTGSYEAGNFQVPQTFAEALRSYAAEVEQHEITQKKLAIAAPKAEAYEEFMGAKGSVSVGDAAKLLTKAGIVTGEKRLFDFLDNEAHWTSKHPLTRKRRIMQTSIDRKVLEYKAQSYEHPKTGERVVAQPQIRVTPKGLHKLRELMLPPMDIGLLEVA